VVRFADTAGAVFTQNLYQLSEHAELGEVDVFLSHSWHDSPSSKWRHLQTWRNNFKVENGREPTIWLDKCCIDQTNVKLNLQCLPVFLAGCNKLLIMAGHTYLSRLWCVVEVFVFLAMGGSPADLELIVLEDEATNSRDRILDMACHIIPVLNIDKMSTP